MTVFAGQRDDSFFVDLNVFNLLEIRELPGLTGGVDGLGGFNVHSIAFQAPIDAFLEDEEDPNPVLGFWSTTSQPRVRLHRTGQRDPLNLGTPIQVSRLGMPLTNEVVIALGDKDKFNASHPSDDGQFLGYVLEPELAGLFNGIYGLGAPESGRADLVAIFLTGISGLNQPDGVTPSEMLRLNTDIEPSDEPDRFGVLGGDLAGFPNGRRLGDDVVDIEFRAVCGVLFDDFVDPLFVPNPVCDVLGDGVNENDKEFMDEFPYLATPHAGVDFMPGGGGVGEEAAIGIGSGLIASGLLLGAVFAIRRRRNGQVA